MTGEQISQHGIKTADAFYQQEGLRIEWRSDQDFQLHCGDGRTLHGDHGLNIEVKFEEKYTGNLFIETWSNRARQRRGWLHHLTGCDTLIYGFIDVATFFVIDIQQLRKINIDGYKEVLQKKAHQANDTYGRLVPIAALAENNTIVRAIGYEISETGFVFKEIIAINALKPTVDERKARIAAAEQWGL